MDSKILARLAILASGFLSRPARPRTAGPDHILLCICNRFEPLHRATKSLAMRRLDEWDRRLPSVRDGFADSDGSGPRHTFFHPAEHCDVDILTRLAAICASGRAETELCLLDTPSEPGALRDKINEALGRLTGHGLLAADGKGRPAYGLMREGRTVNGGRGRADLEAGVLAETGCYADFSGPDALRRFRPRSPNSIFYACAGDGRRMERRLARVGPNVTDALDPPPPRPPLRAGGRDGGLLVVQGPLALDWRARGGPRLMPRIEDGEISGARPPDANRLRLWLKSAVHVIGRPEWLFVKLLARGCDEAGDSTEMLLGRPMRTFLRDVQAFCAGAGARLHYVSARELANIVHAAEDGLAGNPGEYRDYIYRPHGRGARDRNRTAPSPA